MGKQIYKNAMKNKQRNIKCSWNKIVCKLIIIPEDTETVKIKENL